VDLTACALLLRSSGRTVALVSVRVQRLPTHAAEVFASSQSGNGSGIKVTVDEIRLVSAVACCSSASEEAGRSHLDRKKP